MTYIKSPLNYTGNKYRILSQIMEFFPEKNDVMIDLFCGGATVGINTECKKVYFVDSNIRVVNLLKFLANSEFKSLKKKLEKIIEEYGFSYSYKNGYKFYKLECKDVNDNNGLKDYNKSAFYKLRETYNGLKNKNTIKANCYLYLLMIYGFNNDIRFNDNGDFNLPIGKTDLNKQNILKLQSFIEKSKQSDWVFICDSFNSDCVKELINDVDFVYMDPPYLITDAVYNSTWSEEKENDLLSLIDYLIEINKPFVLSNVIEKTNKKNDILLKWFNGHNNLELHNITYHYRSASYNKINRDAKEKEIIITNKKTGENEDK